MKWMIFLLLLTILLLQPKIVFAENNLLINEFLIDPTPQQIEIYNTGDNNVNISHWYLDDSGGSEYFIIPDNTIIYPHACLVFSGNFNLNKSSSDTIRLFNNTATPLEGGAVLVDSYTYDKSMGSGISFYRQIDGDTQWVSGNASIGKFNTNGASCIVNPSPTVTMIPSEAPSPIPTPSYVLTIPPATITATKVIYKNIYISEVMVYPETDSHEWLELYNDNDSSISLIDWYLDDSEDSGSSPKKFSLDVGPKAYGIIDISSSVFNNDEDQVRLLDFNQAVQDSFEYSVVIKGKTIGREQLYKNTFCLQEASKGKVNNPCIPAVLSSIVTATPFLSTTSSPIKPTLTPKKTPPISPQLEKQNPSPFTPRNIVGALNDTNETNEQPTANNTQGMVLGASTQNPSYRIAFMRSLSFASAGLSFLTIIFIVLKMKQR